MGYTRHHYKISNRQYRTVLGSSGVGVEHQKKGRVAVWPDVAYCGLFGPRLFFSTSEIHNATETPTSTTDSSTHLICVMRYNRIGHSSDTTALFQILSSPFSQWQGLAHSFESDTSRRYVTSNPSWCMLLLTYFTDSSHVYSKCSVNLCHYLRFKSTIS